VSAPAIAPIARTITQEQINRYADSSGDHNPIHVDEAFARATPLGGTIAHGMLTLALLSEMLAAGLGEAWLTSGRLRVRFKAPARPGDTVTASARPQGEGYAVECRNQNDEVLISGTAEVAGG
jgi:3-hydroxybutyryl-CoA dehydratase